MSLTLYDMPHSPYCASVRCAMRALGLKWETVPVDNWDRSGVIRASGGIYYAVPLLVDDGRPVFPGAQGVRDIQYYLNDHHAGGRLIPQANRAAQEIVTQYIEDELETAVFKLGDPAHIDGIHDEVARAMVIRHKERKFGHGCIELWRREHEALRVHADLLLQRFEDDLARQPWLFGEEPVFADFALWGVLWNLTFDGRGTFSGEQPALADFFRRLPTYRYAPDRQEATCL